MTRPAITTGETCTSADLNGILYDIPLQYVLAVSEPDKLYSEGYVRSSLPDFSFRVRPFQASQLVLACEVQLTGTAGPSDHFVSELLVVMDDETITVSPAAFYPTGWARKYLRIDAESISSFGDAAGRDALVEVRFWCDGGPGTGAELRNPRFCMDMEGSDPGLLW